MRIIFFSALLICIPVLVQSQTVGAVNFDYRKVVPGMPENASLGSYGKLAVSTGTGVPDISFNLYTLTKDGVSVPISISYDASGIKYTDIPSGVGMKWSLNAGGSINRSINGLVDEGYLWSNLGTVSDSAISYKNAHKTLIDSQAEFEWIANNARDCSFDYYYYNFLDRSGSMFKGKNGAFVPDKDYTKIKIKWVANEFVIKDEKGNTYFFGQSFDKSNVFNSGNHVQQSTNSLETIVSWKLYKILTAHQKIITFSYSDFCYYEYSTLNSEQYVHVQPASQDAPCFSGNHESSYQTSQFQNTAPLLTKISTEDEEILFQYETDISLPIWKKNLVSMKVVSSITHDTIKSISFYHTGTNFLDRFEEKDRNGVTVKKDSFIYFGGAYIDPTSKSRDIFGYANGSSNTTLFGGSSIYYPNTLANRQVNSSFAQEGTLSGIVHPTGGKTFFTYEANIDSIGGVAHYAPGLRVKSVEDIDMDGRVYNKKIYSYRKLHGGMTIGNLLAGTSSPASWNYGVSEVVNSEFSRRGHNGFFYEEVITDQSGGAEHHFTKDYFQYQLNLYENVKPFAVRKDYFKESLSQLARSTRYVYDVTQIDSEAVKSYVLAPPVKYTGNFSYEGQTEIYTFCNKTIYQGFELDMIFTPYVYNLVEEITTDFSSTGDSIVLKKGMTYYNNPNLLESVQTESSTGNQNKILFTYPFNYPSDLLLLEMTDSSSIQHTVSEKLFKNSTALTEKLNTYKEYATGGFVLERQKIQDVASGNYSAFNYYLYNDHAMPVETGKEKDTRTSYIWSYQENYPVAEVTNASYGSIAYSSFEADGKGNWDYTTSGCSSSYGSVTGSKAYTLGTSDIQRTALTSSQTYIITYWLKNSSGSISINGGSEGSVLVSKNDWTLYQREITGVTTVTLSGSGVIDELRLYPKNAQMTSYTYEPLVGMTSSCDVNNRITYYEYDSFNRLLRIRDHDKNILKSYSYTYKEAQ